MDRRVLGLGLASLVAVAAGTGCNLLNKRAAEPVETTSSSTKTESSGSSTLLLDELKTDDLSGAHKPGRGAGTWSSEAREIESHFNVR